MGSSQSSTGEQQASATTDASASYDTKCLSSNGTEKSVGKLFVPGVEHPEQEWPMSETPYVFLSHTGKDGLKEDIIRPTYWFLTKILQVEAFFDQDSSEWGRDKLQVLTPPAYRCTHALVVLSPTFRNREFCVMELNTFMDRLRRHDGIHVLPSLWRMKKLEGYHSDVKDLIWLEDKTEYPVDYMIQSLWPMLCKLLGYCQISTRLLEQHLVTYVDEHWGEPREIPHFLQRFAKIRRLPSLAELSDDSVSSSCSADDRLIVGVTFSSTDVDDICHDWSEKVLRKQQKIEENLKKIVRYGTVTYGDQKMGIERTGFLGLGRAVARLECEIELHQDLSHNQYELVKRATASIARLLTQAGTPQEELEVIMIGTLWKGSLHILLEAREITFKRLFSHLAEAGFRQRVDASAVFVELTPAFLFGGVLGEGFSFENEKGTDAVLLNIEGISLLFPKTSRARGELLVGGLSYALWDTTDKLIWKSLVLVSQQDVEPETSSQHSELADQFQKLEATGEVVKVIGNRVIVHLPQEDKKILVKAENLEAVYSLIPVGTFVELKGLQSQVSLNGLIAVVVDCNECREGKVAVQLLDDSSRILMVKPTNCEIIEDES